MPTSKHITRYKHREGMAKAKISRRIFFRIPEIPEIIHAFNPKADITFGFLHTDLNGPFPVSDSA